jgi:DNA-binding IclR family transcriptional regulator
VLKALEMIETLAQAENGLALSELAERTGHPASTVHRLLTTLAERGYVEQEPQTRRYYLGIKILTLQTQGLRQRQLAQYALPRLSRLKQQVNGTVNLGVVSGKDVVYLETFVPDGSLGFYSPPGTRMPVGCTAMGKLLLAYLPLEAQEELLATLELKPRTPQTITSLGALRNQLVQITTAGYAVDDQEYAVGVRCVAAPIRDHSGKVVAGASMTLPAAQLPLDQIDCTASLLIDACRDISLALGYPGNG